MTINRSALKRNSASALLKKVQDAAASKGKQGGKDDRMWEPTIDANGIGFAVIRFLPSKTEEGLPYVKTYNHGFKEGAKWFIEDCPTTIGQPCPVCDQNSEHWNSGYEADKEIARKRKRKMRYVSNILVIKDPKNPENEGKHFMFSYGAAIFEKLAAAMNPPEEFGDEPRDPFGFFDGCVLKLKIKNKDGYRNYDDSTVDPATDLFDGDEDKLMELLDKMYDINEFLDPKKFKSYEDMKKRFDQTVGNVAAPAAKAEDDEEFEQPKKSEAKEYGQKAKVQESEDPPFEPANKVDEGEDDDDLAFFKSLADD